MVLNEILAQEDFLLSRKIFPKTVELNYAAYCSLIKELEATKYFSGLHGMNILITNTNKITVK